ncbi:LysR family transcriptional regulator [Paenibacillus sp. FSL R7-0345]|uniref:helix-turn-helix domain-containing protein n=1 Tax=Paenibacillus sp. FSL R7-0345 TaxID=2954535 RepID=UPI00315AD1D2
MDEKDWLTLVVLGTERNITKTAERSYLSQPSLTHRLQQLEKELGIGLFVYRLPSAGGTAAFFRSLPAVSVA